MLKLGVNIDHVATLREARYKNLDHGEPDPVEAALICERAGAAGITAHLREDRRHIQDRDIRELRRKIRTRLNLEMAAAPEIVRIALAVKPDIVCLVPERRQEVTTEGGLDVRSGRSRLEKAIRQLTAKGIPVSLFIAPDLERVRASAKIAATFIELHTGAFAEHFRRPAERRKELRRLTDASTLAADLGLRVNAGHGLNYENVQDLLAVPYLEELNIGHSIVSRAIVVGLAAAVGEMVQLLKGYGTGLRSSEQALISSRSRAFRDPWIDSATVFCGESCIRPRLPIAWATAILRLFWPRVSLPRKRSRKHSGPALDRN